MSHLPNRADTVQIGTARALPRDPAAISRDAQSNSTRSSSCLILDDKDANSFALHRVRRLRFSLRGNEDKRDCKEILSQEVTPVS
jgi:hypothetical protein